MYHHTNLMSSFIREQPEESIKIKPLKTLNSPGLLERQRLIDSINKGYLIQ